MHAGAFMSAAAAGALFRTPRGLPVDSPTVIEVDDDDIDEFTFGTDDDDEVDE
jgi:hypothetical protein